MRFTKTKNPAVQNCYLLKTNPAGKYWSPGRPEERNVASVSSPLAQRIQPSEIFYV